MTSISAFQTTRKISQINVGAYDKDINPYLGTEEIKTGTKMGMDSHADTTCVNKHAFIESVIEGLTVDAILFDDSIGKMSNLPIVHAIYAYDNTESLRIFLLRFNNEIFIKNMKNALLCSNQAIEHGTIVDDVPPHLYHTGQSTFSVSTSEHALHLQQHGPTACLKLHRPTNEEMDNLDIYRYH